MKKIFITLVFAMSILNCVAQGEQTSKKDSIADDYQKYNEVKLNGVMLLIGAFEASYERNLNSESSVGASFFIPYDDENLDGSLNYYFSPYYRVFFGKKYAAGFFVEGFTMLNSNEGDAYFKDEVFKDYRDDDILDLALGLGLGGKWVTRSGIIFELNAGIGRNLLNAEKTDITIVGKFGFNVGYRF